MSVSFVNRMADLVIPGDNVTVISNVLSADYDYGDAAAIGLAALTLQAGTFLVQVSVDGTNWYTYEEANPLAAFLFPTQGNAVVSTGLVVWPYIRLHVSAAAAAPTTVQTSKHWTAGAGLAG
jgi:hypothetical protein